MNRNKNLPLTETVFYILLALAEPRHGYMIMQKVEELSEGQVKLAAGTLYGAIENLLKLDYIEPVQSDDVRRKVYIITDMGKQILRLEIDRMQHLLNISESCLL